MTVNPPVQETLPTEQHSLQSIQQKFWELQQQVCAQRTGSLSVGLSVCLLAAPELLH